MAPLLCDEPSYRTEIKRQVLLRLFEHLDDTFLGIPCYVSDNFHTQLRSVFRKIQRREVDINVYRLYDRRHNGPDSIIVLLHDTYRRVSPLLMADS